MMKTDEYFARKASEEDSFLEKRKELEEAKKEAVEKYGFDDERTKRAYEELDALKNPLEAGEIKAIIARREALENFPDEQAVLTDYLQESEVKTFADAVKASGITEIAVADESTALMETLHLLEAEGLFASELTVLKKVPDKWTGKERNVRAVRLVVGERKSVGGNGSEWIETQDQIGRRIIVRKSAVICAEKTSENETTLHVGENDRCLRVRRSFRDVAAELGCVVSD